MRDDRRQELRSMYLRLGVGELFAAAAFAVMAGAVVTPRLDGSDERAALWSALAPLLLILVQAGIYWLLARTWVGTGTMPPTLSALYRAFRLLDPVVLAAGLVGIVVWWPGQPEVVVLAAVVWLFGVVEYVNYFLVRLSYPVGQWFGAVGQWRTPRLVQDLRATTLGGAR